MRKWGWGYKLVIGVTGSPWNMRYESTSKMIPAGAPRIFEEAAASTWRPCQIQQSARGWRVARHLRPVVPFCRGTCMDTKHEAASTNIWVQNSGPNPNFPTLKFRLLALISSSRLHPPPAPLPTHCHHTVLPLHLVHINLSPTNCNHTVHHLTISCQHQLPHSFCVAGVVLSATR